MKATFGNSTNLPTYTNNFAVTRIVSYHGDFGSGMQLVAEARFYTTRRGGTSIYCQFSLFGKNFRRAAGVARGHGYDKELAALLLATGCANISLDVEPQSVEELLLAVVEATEVKKESLYFVNVCA